MLGHSSDGEGQRPAQSRCRCPAHQEAQEEGPQEDRDLAAQQSGGPEEVPQEAEGAPRPHLAPEPAQASLHQVSLGGCVSSVVCTEGWQRTSDEEWQGPYQRDLHSQLHLPRTL